MNDVSKTTKTDTQKDGGKTAFACQLKAARERTGKKQSQFYSQIKDGISPGDGSRTYDAISLTSNVSYNQYEIGKSFPSLPILRRLAYYCNVSADELLGIYDAKYYCRLIKKIFPDTALTTTDLPLAPDEWPNDTNCKLRIKVTAPEGREYYPSITELENIRKNCWDDYQLTLSKQIASHLRREIFREKLLREEFNYTDEQLVFLRKLAFLALNETFETPVIERNQTATNAFNDFCRQITANPQLYEGCFQGNIDIAICFYLMTNINPASAGNRIPALFKFHALKMQGGKNLPFTVPSAEFGKALSVMSKADGLLKRMNCDSNADLSYFKGGNPFHNEFYRFLISRIKSFTAVNSQQNGTPAPEDPSRVKTTEYNPVTHANLKILLLDKLVTEGKYFENGQWKAYTDYRPAFFSNDKETPLTAEEIKQLLNRDLFGFKPSKPQTKRPPGLTKSIHKGDGHGGY